MFTTNGARVNMAEGLNYASGWLDGAGEPWDQQTVWVFALMWSRVERMQVGRRPIKDMWQEFRATGRIAFSERGRKRWLEAATRNGTTGVVTMALPHDLGDGDVIVAPGGTETFYVRVERVSEPPYPRSGDLLRTIHGRVVRPIGSEGEDVLAHVDVRPDQPVELTTIGEALDRLHS